MRQKNNYERPNLYLTKCLGFAHSKAQSSHDFKNKQANCSAEPSCWSLDFSDAPLYKMCRFVTLSLPAITYEWILQGKKIKFCSQRQYSAAQIIILLEAHSLLIYPLKNQDCDFSLHIPDTKTRPACLTEDKERWEAERGRDYKLNVKYVRKLWLYSQSTALTLSKHQVVYLKWRQLL